MTDKNDGKKYVEGLFPEVKEIKDPDIRQKVIDCWLTALEESQWDRIEAMPWIPGRIHLITNVEHCRGTTRMGMAMARAIMSSQDVAPGATVDTDTVIAGCLLHDVGKLLEYAGPSNETGGKTPLGKRMAHHILGSHVAIKVGVNSEIVHCIEYHLAPETNKRSLEAQIVRNADRCISWSIFKGHPELADYNPLLEL